MRTYTRDTFVGARAAWESGNFGSEWAELRRLSWDNGYPYPPVGTEFDDRDADSPSPRSIVYRALVDQPTELRRIVVQSRSWGQVVDRIIGLESRLREDAGLTDREAEYDRAERPTHRDAVMSLASVLRRIDESRS